jgi:FMN phosphatase YigB (HAD superfamily)
LNKQIIALDIGGVCLNIRHDLCYEYFGFKTINEVPGDFLLSVEKLEKGIISESQWLDDFYRITGGKYTHEQLIEGWNLIIGEEITEMAKLVKDLVDANFRLIYFSDTSTIHINECYRKLSFSNMITGAIFSFEVGARKPDTAMYLAFEEKYGKPCFYADDRVENVKEGTRHGWESHLFTTSKAMRDAIGI